MLGWVRKVGIGLVRTFYNADCIQLFFLISKNISKKFKNSLLQDVFKHIDTDNKSVFAATCHSHIITLYLVICLRVCFLIHIHHWK